MAPSRKRQRELDRLKGQAEDLWGDQKDVLERANRVLKAASRQARDEAVTRGRGVYDSRVRPAVASGIASGRDRLHDDVFPAVSGALGSALAILEAARNPDVRAALGRATSAGRAVASRTGLVKAKSTPGPGRYILIGVGIVAAAGIAYAAWQTLRSDDDLWIDDEELTEGGAEQPS
ncbi:MAG TPA: hypothetical protein VGF80_01620 [Galbitalea sp.]|jgi:hypothetical protein